MNFEEEVNANRARMNAPPVPAARPSLPEWHAPLLAELQKSRLQSVQVYASQPPRQRRTLTLERITQTDYRPFENGWVLSYTVLWREPSYMLTETIYVGPSFIDSYPFFRTNDAQVQRGAPIARTAPSLTRGLPRGGAWVVNPQSTSSPRLGREGAAYLVAKLRETGTLSRNKQGILS